LLGGTSYCSASDQRLLMGLGRLEKVSSVIVHWPSGQVTTTKDVPIDRYLTIREEATPTGRR